MEYRELAPPAELARDFACVWYDDRSALLSSPRRQLVLPDGCIDIIWMRGREPSVAGAATLPVEAHIPPGATVVGARFAPGTAPSYLDVPADALLNLDIPLREVWGDDADRLWDQLERTDTVAEGLRALETALRSRRARMPDTLVQRAVSQLQELPEHSVSELSDRLGLSERHLLRRFRAAVGYGPRVFGRVVRLRRFLTLVTRHGRHGRDLTRLAAEAGFADHSHLVRECVELAGMTPAQLRVRWTD